MRRDYGAFSFEIPPEWKDQAIVFVGPPVETGNTPNIVVTRAPRRPGEVLEAVVWRTMFETSTHLRDFSLLDSKKTQVAHRPAMMTRFRSTNDRGVATQTSVFVDSPDGEVVSLSCSILSAPEEEPATDAEWMRTFTRIVESMLVASPVSDVAPRMGSTPPPARPSSPDPIEADTMLFPMPGDRRRANH